MFAVDERSSCTFCSFIWAASVALLVCERWISGICFLISRIYATQTAVLYGTASNGTALNGLPRPHSVLKTTSVKKIWLRNSSSEKKSPKESTAQTPYGITKRIKKATEMNETPSYLVWPYMESFEFFHLHTRISVGLLTKWLTDILVYHW